MSSKRQGNFVVRQIKGGDLTRGFFDTLSNLAPVGNLITQNKRAEKILSKIRSYPFHATFVAVKEDGEVIGSITILIEQKFIHDGGKVGHIEDVVTRNGYEGRGVGKALVVKAIDFAAKEKCYKVVLDCSRSNIEFYQKLGFKQHEISMRMDL
ncbi:MAG TPA: GNAT family N-acetyltransferase [Nitrososphaeraceae archaeon]|nr:GNAT family N-acetyltransferase [Nitrososphaeraceae archaeon]